MRRFANAFTAFLFGCGILALAVGLFSNVYSWQYGLIIMVALWVIAFALRVFLSTRGDD